MRTPTQPREKKEILPNLLLVIPRSDSYTEGSKFVSYTQDSMSYTKYTDPTQTLNYPTRIVAKFISKNPLKHDRNRRPRHRITLSPICTSRDRHFYSFINEIDKWHHWCQSGATLVPIWCQWHQPPNV